VSKAATEPRYVLLPGGLRARVVTPPTTAEQVDAWCVEHKHDPSSGEHDPLATRTIVRRIGRGASRP